MKAAIAMGLAVAGALALAGCTSARVARPAVDPVLRELAGNALASYEQGDADRAAQLYERARDRARLIGDSREVALNAYNLALCRLARGRTAEARTLLKEARVWLSPRGAEAARIWLAEADAAGRDGRPEEARRCAQRALEVGADAADRAQARIELAAIACGTNDVATAKRMLAAAESDLRRAGAPLLHARAARVAARVAGSDGDASGVGVAREREAAWLRQAGNHREMALALVAAGESYRKAGQPRKAFACLLRAAASLKASGAAAQAAAAATEAAACAQEAGEKDWAAAADALTADPRKP